jgi:ubiquinone/menaquinone biosynthesis C-methylase UbiE
MTTSTSLSSNGADSTIRDFERHYQQLYTEQAHRYEPARFSHQDAKSFNALEQVRIFELLGLKPGQTVLDVPTGTGRIAAHMAAQGLKTTALDLTFNMLKETRAKARQGELPNLSCVEATGRTLPFEDGTFDGVYSIRFFHLFPVAIYAPFVQEMWRVVKPGGVMLLQFDSALAGGIANWIRELRWRRERGRAHSFLWPHQIPQVFEGIPNLTYHGYSAVGVRFVRRASPAAADVLEQAFAEGNRSFFASKLFVRAVKPK